MDPNKGLWLLLAVAITTVLLSPGQRGSDAPPHTGQGASGTPTSAAQSPATRVSQASCWLHWDVRSTRRPSGATPCWPKTGRW